MVGASADFLLERRRLAHSRGGLAQVLGEGAALLERVRVERAAGILIGGATKSEHGLFLLRSVDLGRLSLGRETQRRLQNGGGVQVGARAHRGRYIARLETAHDAVVGGLGGGASIGAGRGTHGAAAEACRDGGRRRLGNTASDRG